jgi:Icc-related predicted phosphoesterase
MSGIERRGARRDESRAVRIAAVGDLHYDGSSNAPGSLRDVFADINRSADILVIAGDLTTHGRPEQMKGFVEELVGVQIPIVAVLGNHDCESGFETEVSAILRDRGVQLLDGDHVVIEGIGFAGTKGFAGGFGRGALAPFGERIIKEFVQASIDEAIKLENALRNLGTETRIVLLHYSPILDTVLGEPETIYAFLGSSRLVQPLDTLGATVVFHGHAHHGSLEGTTPSGIPVHNVAWPLLREQNQNFLMWSVAAPNRRREERIDQAGPAAESDRRGGQVEGARPRQQARQP